MLNTRNDPASLLPTRKAYYGIAAGLERDFGKVRFIIVASHADTIKALAQEFGVKLDPTKCRPVAVVQLPTTNEPTQNP